MTEQLLRQAFHDALKVPEGAIHDGLQYATIPEWDSVGHMSLVAEIEARFDVMLDTEEILALSTFAKAREILQKHGVSFRA